MSPIARVDQISVMCRVFYRRPIPIGRVLDSCHSEASAHRSAVPRSGEASLGRVWVATVLEFVGS